MDKQYHVTKQHVGRPCRFRSHNGEDYYGHIIAVQRDIITVNYHVPGLVENVNAYIPKSAKQVEAY